jgi:hypothetical protein
MGIGVGGEGSRAMRRRLGHALIRRATFSPREKEERERSTSKQYARARFYRRPTATFFASEALSRTRQRFAQGFLS